MSSVNKIKTMQQTIWKITITEDKNIEKCSVERQVFAACFKTIQKYHLIKRKLASEWA